MTRPLRIEFPGAVYHVTSRGTRRCAIYRERRDYHLWHDLLGETADRYNFAVYAFCQMPNHFHLLVETAEGNLSQGMRHLNSRYAQRFNHRYRSCGPLLQGRYHPVLIEHQSQLLEVARYVVLNPVRARLVRSETEWEWSSHKYLIGQQSSPSWLETRWLLRQFGRSPIRARAAYIRFVKQGYGQPNPLSDARSELILGRTPDLMAPEDCQLKTRPGAPDKYWPTRWRNTPEVILTATKPWRAPIIRPHIPCEKSGNFSQFQRRRSAAPYGNGLKKDELVSECRI